MHNVSRRDARWAIVALLACVPSCANVLGIRDFASIGDEGGTSDGPSGDATKLDSGPPGDSGPPVDSTPPVDSGPPDAQASIDAAPASDASAACDAGASCTDPAIPCVKKTYDCRTGTAACTAAGNAVDGTPCNGTMYCYSGVCSACTLAAPCSPASKPCDVGKVTSCAGGTAVCTDQNTPAAAGVACQTASVPSGVCDGQGSCVSCTPNANCSPPNTPCKSGTMSCSMGAVCNPTGNINEGLACGSGTICASGSCVACNASTCASGCCDTTGCLAGAAQSSSKCGGGGSSCGACPGGASCSGGSCSCPSGQTACGSACTTLGGGCGTCGKYACDAGAVWCDDPGASNMCPTWCSSQTAPSGVAASDYQCVDFDNALPPSTTWVPATTGNGTLTRSTSQFDSASYSLQASVSAISNASTPDTATLTWSDTGSASVSSVSVSVGINPVTIISLGQSWSGNISLVCITTGTSNFVVCLNYTYGSNTGYYLMWGYSGGIATAGTCQISANLTTGVWNQVQLSLTMSTGAIQLLVNGTSALNGCSNAKPDPTTTAAVSVGLATSGTTASGWTAYFDNIVASVHR